MDFVVVIMGFDEAVGLDWDDDWSDGSRDRKDSAAMAQYVNPATRLVNGLLAGLAIAMEEHTMRFVIRRLRNPTIIRLHRH